MFKKVSALALLLLSISSVKAADLQEVVCLSTDLNETEEEMIVRRHRGCKCFCCLNVSGNVNIGGTLTLAGRSVNSLFALQTFAGFYNSSAGVPLIQNQSVPFPTAGPTSNSGITGASTSFTLSAIGTYEVTWQANVTQIVPNSTTQFALFLDPATSIPAIVPGTTVGHNLVTPGDAVQVVGSSFITTTAANSLLSVRLVSVGNVTMNPNADDTATITIKRLS